MSAPGFWFASSRKYTASSGIPQAWLLAAARILHSKIAITIGIYTEVPDDETHDALDQDQKWSAAR
jgi:hypothetical protein